MQKKDNKWSILIWSIFLVLFMSFSFLVTSRQVSDNIKKMGQYNDIISNELSIPDNLWVNNYYWLIKNNESTEFRFSKESTATWKLFLETWWPLQYKTLKINSSWNWISWSSSWIIYKWNYIEYELALDSDYYIWLLYLRNIWWLSKVIIESNDDFLYKDNLLENRDLIWNKEVSNNKIYIKNFTNWEIDSRFGISDYREKDLYLDN